MKRNAKIEFGGVPPSCFAYPSWPLNAQSNPAGIKVLRVEDGDGRSHYFSTPSTSTSVGSTTSGSPCVLRLNSKFGKSLGLVENEVVPVTEMNLGPVEIERAHLACVSSDDWEILESNASVVVNELLNQLRVVYPGQIIPFWITKTLQINLKIERLAPSHLEYGILTANSEIVVPSIPSKSKPFGFQPSRSHLRLRVHPVSIPEHILCGFPTSSLLLKNPRNVFIFHESTEDVEKRRFSPKDKGEGQNFDFDPFFYGELLLASSSVRVGVKVFFLEHCEINAELSPYFPRTNPPPIYLHPELIKRHEMEVGSCIYLSSKREGSESGSLELVGLGQTEELPEERIFCPLLEECKGFIQASLSLGPVPQPFIGPNNGSLLIEGRFGSGKTQLCSTLGKQLGGFPYFVHHEIFPCAKWKGKKAETIEKDLKTILERCEALQPSTLFLDDLDIITPVGMAQQENLQEQFLHFKICETIRETLMTVRDQQITLIATAKSKESLNPYWISRQGFHFFHKVVFIPPPNPVERLAIFQDHFKSHPNPHDILQSFSIQSSPQIFSLLKTIHEQTASPRIVVNIAKKAAIQFASSPAPGEIGIEKLLSSIVQDEVKFCEMEGKGNKKQPSTGAPSIKWDEIGGLAQVKMELVKILQWPIKYANLFKNSPIRLPAGILFYGYPGTGKTLLGLAVPSLVNAKFIHIKGPELLSKYIGASEQAVQDVFKRARHSSPCIIFFDEFDSLVPRRGHDSTGVTDRVVNQFLAEMDGIEGGLGKGVYLIGSTSRPDLIDPAVLRPGRLDKHFFFDLPNKEERKEIFQILGKQINLNITPNDALLQQMDGFSGADLYSLICSAQLSAVQKYFGKLGNVGENNEAFTGNEELTPSDIPVQMEDLLDALSTFKASLYGQELTKFKNIYETFSTKGDEGSNKTLFAGKRATLA